jgi:hypothetical protein
MLKFLKIIWAQIFDGGRKYQKMYAVSRKYDPGFDPVSLSNNSCTAGWQIIRPHILTLLTLPSLRGPRTHHHAKKATKKETSSFMLLHSFLCNPHYFFFSFFSPCLFSASVTFIVFWKLKNVVKINERERMNILLHLCLFVTFPKMQRFSNLCASVSTLKSLLKHSSLGCTSAVSDSISLGWAQEFILLTSSQVTQMAMQLVRGPYFVMNVCVCVWCDIHICNLYM